MSTVSQFNIRWQIWESLAISANDLSAIPWTVFRFPWCVHQHVYGTQICRNKKSAEDKSCAPSGDATRAAHFDTTIASPRFKINRPVISPRRFVASLILRDLGPVWSRLQWSNHRGHYRRGRLSAWRRARSTRLCFLVGAISRSQ